MSLDDAPRSSRWRPLGLTRTAAGTCKQEAEPACRETRRALVGGSGRALQSGGGPGCRSPGQARMAGEEHRPIPPAPACRVGTVTSSHWSLSGCPRWMGVDRAHKTGAIRSGIQSMRCPPWTHSHSTQPRTTPREHDRSWKRTQIRLLFRDVHCRRRHHLVYLLTRAGETDRRKRAKGTAYRLPPVHWISTAPNYLAASAPWTGRTSTVAARASWWGTARLRHTGCRGGRKFTDMICGSA